MPACAADQENGAVETEWYFQFYILWIILQVLNKDTKIQLSFLRNARTLNLKYLE